MPDYKNMYFSLFNKITDVINDLVEIQQMTEEIYIVEENPKITILPRKDDKTEPK